jgi:hypothetical protein
VRSNVLAYWLNAVVASKNTAEEKTTRLSNSVNCDLTNGLNRINKKPVT